MFRSRGDKVGSAKFEGLTAMKTQNYLRGCIQKFPDWVDNEKYDYKNKHSLRSNTKAYGGKTH
jgi:hypothetical protein